MFSSISNVTLILIIIALIFIASLAYRLYKASKNGALTMYTILPMLVDEIVSMLPVVEDLVKAAGSIPALESLVAGLLTSYVDSSKWLTAGQIKLILDNMDEAVAWVINELITLKVIKNPAINSTKYPMYRSVGPKTPDGIFDKSVKIPAGFNILSILPKVFDQGQEGSCTANAGCTAVSMALGTPQLILSRQYEYQNEKKLEKTPLSEDSGAQMVDIGRAACQFGIPLESLFDYIPENMTATPSAAAVADAANHKPSINKSVTSLASAKQLIATLKLPVLVGISIYSSFESDVVAKTGVVPMPKRGDQLLGGHAVEIVGYQDSTTKLSLVETICSAFGKSVAVKSAGYVIIRNSWGEDWGINKGYCHIPYEYITAYGYDMFVIQK